MKHDREKVIELIQETLEALDKYYQKSKIDRINTANVLYSELESAGYIASEGWSICQKCGLNKIFGTSDKHCTCREVAPTQEPTYGVTGDKIHHESESDRGHIPKNASAGILRDLLLEIDHQLAELGYININKYKPEKTFDYLKMEPVNQTTTLKQNTSTTLKDEIRFNYTQEPQGTVGQVWDWQKAKWVDEKDLTPTEHSKSNYKRLDAMGFHDKLESIKRTMTQEEWDKLRTPIQEPTYEVVWGANQKISHTAGSEYIEGDGKFEVKTQEPVKPDIKWKIQSGKLDESNNLVIYELIDGYHVVKIKAEQTDGGGV